MGPVNFLSAKKETASSDVKLEKKDQQTETTQKTNEGLEHDKNDTMKMIESSNKPPAEKEGKTPTESSDYFLSQNNQEW